MEFLDFLHQIQNSLEVFVNSQFTINWLEAQENRIQLLRELAVSEDRDILLEEETLQKVTQLYARQILEIMKPNIPDVEIFKKIAGWKECPAITGYSQRLA